jgi:hypothetical protein
MADGDLLTTVARDQERWSLTANALKGGIETARWMVLGLAVAGAIFETAAAQIHKPDPNLALVLGYSGAVALAIAAVIHQRVLGQDRNRAWILARAGSESFKHEMYLFRTLSGPYATGNPVDPLDTRRQDILTKLAPVQKFAVEPKEGVKTPAMLDGAGYLQDRITGDKGQVKYFRDHASTYSTIQGWLNRAEFVLALIAAILGAAATAKEKREFGAWVAVITTIMGAIASHSLAQRYEQLTVSYRTAADRLEGIVGRWQGKPGASLAELVEPCEAALLEQNQGWIAGADPAPPKPPANPVR